MKGAFKTKKMAGMLRETMSRETVVRFDRKKPLLSGNITGSSRARIKKPQPAVLPGIGRPGAEQILKESHGWGVRETGIRPGGEGRRPCQVGKNHRGKGVLLASKGLTLNRERAHLSQEGEKGGGGEELESDSKKEGFRKSGNLRNEEGEKIYPNGKNILVI